MKSDEDHHHKCRPFLKVHHFMATSLILWWKVRKEKHFIPYSVLNNVDECVLILWWIIIQFMGSRWEIFSLQLSDTWLFINWTIDKKFHRFVVQLPFQIYYFRSTILDILFQIYYFRYTILDILFQIYSFRCIHTLEKSKYQQHAMQFCSHFFHHSKKVIH